MNSINSKNFNNKENEKKGIFIKMLSDSSGVSFGIGKTKWFKATDSFFPLFVELTTIIALGAILILKIKRKFTVDSVFIIIILIILVIIFFIFLSQLKALWVKVILRLLENEIQIITSVSSLYKSIKKLHYQDIKKIAIETISTPKFIKPKYLSITTTEKTFYLWQNIGLMDDAQLKIIKQEIENRIQESKNKNSG